MRGGLDIFEVLKSLVLDLGLGRHTWQDNVALIIGDDGKPRARQCVLRPGMPSMSFSISCVKHKCQICKKPDQWPSLDDLHKRIIDGQTLATAEEHRRIFPKP